MNRLVSDMSRILALLASLLLPIQPSLAASCCGHDGQGHANHTSADSSKKSCSQHDKARCCSELNDLEQSCCEGDSSNSKSELSRCSDRCYENAPPIAADLAMVGPCLEDDLSVVTINNISTLVRESTAQGSIANSVAIHSESGSERCVRFCRYRL